ncbi:acetamidase/formamidase family protein [Lichenihabitans sp. PAMC28606]|uniref:acetamidase/formamidase family protein n=1 Tax=Lichenihabitans sp. PAMC28606 TaxID=2880932 RepID=UPI001D0A997C|nr:acetamidase/formamidase family protein [Lichenihabitans sp. PAMC28606]UDL94054.1 acetamidase/formamidase family protein [Lichenihabitans sp. PAMC28606]
MTQRISKQGTIKYALSGDDAFVAHVDPGETVTIECVINIGDGVIKHVGQQLTEADVTFPFVNGATGPIEVVGAMPGDMLKVEILHMELDTLGYSSLWPGHGMFPDWVRRKEFGIQTRVVDVLDGVVHWTDTIKLPCKPMAGVIGVAPIHGAVLTVDNGTHGGNLDVQEITAGSIIMLRVEKPGAHFFIGDCHALQGDGEAVGMGAIEIGSNVTLRITIEKAPKRLGHPRIETATHLCTLGCARPLEDAMRIAFQEMIYWLNDEWNIPEPDGYLLLAQIAEARCTQMVNPKYTYICKVSKEILAQFT